MSTGPVMSITDDQIAEIEALANDAAPFDWGPDIGMTHAETVYACSVGPDSILALITRLREAERDAARYKVLREEPFTQVKVNRLELSHEDLDAAIDTAMQESEQ